MQPVTLNHVWHYTQVDQDFWDRNLEAWMPARVFDAHTHVNEPEFRRAQPSAAKRRQYWVNEVAEPIGAAAAQRCQQIVFPGREVSCLCFGMPELDYDVEASNRRLQADCLSRGWYTLAVTLPEWSADRLEVELSAARVLGAKPYYALLGRDPSSRDTYLEAGIFDFLPHHQLEVLDARRAWVTLHVPKAERLGHPQNLAEIRELRRRYPRVTLVIAHLGRCYTLEHAREALPPLADDEGIYFDSSAVLNADVYEFALQTLGPGRILYGTDNPIFYMRGRRQFSERTYVNRTSYPFYFNRDREPPEVEAQYTLFMYEDLLALRDACQRRSLGRGDVEAIFHDNARRLAATANPQSTPTPSRSLP
jgi:hypothetical protein